MFDDKIGGRKGINHAAAFTGLCYWIFPESTAEDSLTPHRAPHTHRTQPETKNLVSNYLKSPHQRCKECAQEARGRWSMMYGYLVSCFFPLHGPAWAHTFSSGRRVHFGGWEDVTQSPYLACDPCSSLLKSFTRSRD